MKHKLGKEIGLNAFIKYGSWGNTSIYLGFQVFQLHQQQTLTSPRPKMKDSLSRHLHLHLSNTVR